MHHAGTTGDDSHNSCSCMTAIASKQLQNKRGSYTAHFGSRCSLTSSFINLLTRKKKRQSGLCGVMDQVDIREVSHLIHSAKNVLILLGAGLSQPSGIPTFQEPWEEVMPREMSSPSFFRADPSTSWRFFEDRRQKALRAVPNAGHVAIADFARRNEHVFTITQNVDGRLLDA